MEYLRAGAKLFNNGQHELAAKYLKAAHDYRDQLTAEEQATLNDYRTALAKVQDDAVNPAAASSPAPETAPAEPSAKDQAVALVAQARQALAAGRVDEARGLAHRADALDAPFDAAEDSPAKLLAELEAPAGGTAPRAGTIDSKQSARWLLLQAREQIRLGRLDAADEKLAEARRMNVRWRLFDDVTPDKVDDELQKARSRTQAAAAPASSGTRAQAKERLQEARAALAGNQYDQAEAIATEVGSWDLSFGMFDDSPAKVAAAAHALRRRDALRQTKPQAQPSQELYDILVREARELMAAGRLEEAEAKARQAQRMNVVPAVTADRAEAVLNDLAAVLAARTPAPATGAADAMTAPVIPIAEPLSAALEREANQLLARGDRAAAAAKFTEAERRRAQEIGRAVMADAPARAPDPAVVPAATAAPDPVQVPLITLEPAPSPPAPAMLPAAAIEPAVIPAAVAAEPAPVPTPPAAVELAPAVAVEPAPSPAVAAEPVLAPAAPESAGQTLLEQARTLLANGNFAAARQAAAQAKASGSGVEPQADELLAQIALAQQGGALKLYEAALAALRKGDPARARALLTEVAALGEALDESMTQRVQDLLLKLPKDAAGAAAPAAIDPLTAQSEAEAIKAQQLNAEVGTKVAEARQLLETDPDKAIALLRTTIDTVQAASLSPAVSRTMVRRLEVAIELAKKDKVAFDAKMQDKRQRAEIEQKRLRILEAGKAKQERVKQLMDKAQAAMAEGKFAEAEGFAKQAQEIAPNEIAPGALATVARVRRHYELDKKIRSDKEESFLNDLQLVDGSSIIPDDTRERGISYPKTFADLTDRRRRFLAEQEPKKDAGTLKIEAKLNEPVSVNLDKQPLGEALEFLRNYTGLNVVPDTKAYLEEGITSETPVTLQVNNVKLKTALKFMLQPLGLTYKIEDEVLLLTTPQSRSKTYAVTYPVADLVMSPRRMQRSSAPGLAPAPAAVPDPNLPPMPGVPAPFGALGAGADAGPAGQAATADRPDVDMTPLIQLITTTIAPGTWRVGDGAGDLSGGGFGQGAGFGADATIGGGVPENPIGSITPFNLNISLIIRQTAEVHDQIVDLLRQLRRLQDLQVAVEVRFITVDDQFFEQIGVDFDFSIQSDVAGKKTSFAVANPNAVPEDPTAATGTSPYLINPARDHSIGSRPITVGRASNGNTGNFTSDLQIPFLQSSADLATTAAAVTGAGANFGIAFLSDLELYLFLTALQGDTRANVVQAPKVTSFNGAPAFISNTTQRYYVSQLIPVVNAGALAYTPVPAAIPDGVQLSVTPVVSADRRYVRLTLAPNFIAFNRFDSFPVAGGVGGGGLGGGATQVTGSIQLPVFTQTTVDTTVTVPDGGTVLLGGVKRLNEERREFGTPILSKTPLINRLFRNIGISRSASSLMLMVTPRIIILEEEEERLGIPAVSTPTL